MRLLLDTHIAVWSAFDLKRLSPNARRMIEEAHPDAGVSAVSVWEVAIKRALPRRGATWLPMSGAAALAAWKAAGFELLSVTPEHAAAVDLLPAIHGDPFDRLLVAQAKVEPMRFLTHDARLAGYGELVVVA